MVKIKFSFKLEGNFSSNFYVNFYFNNFTRNGHQRKMFEELHNFDLISLLTEKFKIVMKKNYRIKVNSASITHFKFLNF